MTSEPVRDRPLARSAAKSFALAFVASGIAALGFGSLAGAQDIAGFDSSQPRIDATGGVTVTRGSERAQGAAGVYDFNRNVIILSGGVALRRGGDTLNGGRLTIDLDTGLSTVDGGRASGQQGGRVTGTFSVPQN